MDVTEAEVTRPTTTSSKQENVHIVMDETNNHLRECRTSRRERRERITAARQQQQPLRHHSDHVRPSSTAADDDFEAVAMVELERASTDAAIVGDRLFAQQTSTFSVGRMSSSSAHHQEAAAPAVTPRIASAPLTPPAMISHRRSASERFDSRSATDSIDIRSTLREDHTRTQPGAYVASGPPVDVPTWMVHAANDNNTNGNRRFRLSQEDRMDSVTFREWLDSQQEQEEEGQDETSMDLFAAEYDQDSLIDASVDVCVQAAPITTSTPTSGGGGGNVVGGNNSQATLLEHSFNSIPPEYRPVCNTYSPPLSPTANSSSSSSEESDTNPQQQQQQQQQQQRTPKIKRVRKLMKKIKKVTIEVTKEIVDLM